MTKRTTHTVAPVVPNVLYPLEGFTNVCGTGTKRLHELHADGRLRLKREWNRYWILGQEWIDYVLTQDAMPRRRGRSEDAPRMTGHNPQGGIMCHGEPTGNLCLTRKPGESFRIGDDITVTVTKCGIGRTTVSIQAPRSTKVLRSELEEDAVGKVFHRHGR